MSQTVEVRFKGTRKAYFLWPGEEPLRVGEAVIVEVERGRDLGRVTAIGDLAEKKCGGGCSGCAVGGEAEEPAPLKQVMGRATAEDLKAHDEIRRSEEDARRKVVQRVRAHDLVMKVSDTEWQWDRNKLTIYFTAEKRVDFRALVRDLASTFRTRIELRQIGVRDEAARLSGVGRCGREYCCSSWLKELGPGQPRARQGPASLAQSRPRSPAAAAGCSAASSTSTSSTWRPGSAFPRRGRRSAPRSARSGSSRWTSSASGSSSGARSRAPASSPLVQLKEEVEQLGEVLVTAEYRAKLAAQEAEAAGNGGTAVAEGTETDDGGGPERPERRRRRRGRDSGGTPLG